MPHIDLFSLNPIAETFNTQPPFGWIFDDLPDAVFPTLPSFSNAPALASSQPLQNTEMQPFRTTEDVPGGLGLGKLATTPAPGKDTTSSEDLWSGDCTPFHSQRSVLPDFGRVDETPPAATHCASVQITPSMRMKILESVQGPLNCGAWPKAEWNPGSTQEEYYITAQLLQGTHGYCSGSKRLLETAECWRSALVNTAKSTGLFNYEPAQHLLSECKSAEERWKVWIGQERRRRLSWAVYEYDSSVSYLHNIRPYVTVGDMILDLPSSPPHWEAETAYSWAALHPWGPGPKYSAFRSTIRHFFDGTADPLSRLDEDNQRLPIMLTLIRMLWTVKEIRRSPICDLIDNSHWVNDARSLLKGINMFQESIVSLTASAKCTVDQILQAVRRAQMVHLAHLYGAGDLLDLVYVMIRQSPARDTAQERLRQWAKHDARRVRHVAFHAAQILALVRHWPGNAPLESFNVFHAGVVLCCMCVLLPSNQTSEVVFPRARADDAVRLDHLAMDQNDPRMNSIQAWVRDGGHRTVCIFGINDLTITMAQRQVLELTAEILGNMQVWGVSQYFRKIILDLSRKTPWDGVRPAFLRVEKA
ncbi:uncharacterized protein A1O9_01405 [Exophiala aquamarina CBS 119918]|uniref:Xylanolytic transcriptional activator regulatory domain-containing protein n=1 Tax=Exophiala aquamarina CBS 119918 TaxID=1182545 RepID=A0A072PUK7_9EURO|nr:uncharacterized protein A1O9_01405 [Exophiala aquamarina CBS 119918]KEF63427.1 hypothetical protein A1O9_01405 [Exophiala aquamarina CBS 119918]